MNYTALSLNQTPPLSVPLPYFLAAPLFMLAAALILLLSGPEVLLTRWSPTMLALTHLLTIGFLGTIMLGALQQLVPVLIGVPLPAQRGVAYSLFTLWLVGAGVLIGGMGTATPLAVRGGAILLATVVGIFIFMVARSLWRSTSRHATLTSMALAAFSLVVTIAFALYLVMRFGGLLPLAHPLTALHIGWASLGWVFILLSGVAYQVVPMFQITPEYPGLMRRLLALSMWEGLAIWSAQVVFPGLVHTAWLLAAGVVIFALQTLHLQARRRRKLADVSLDYWRLAMLSLIVAVLLWAFDAVKPAVQTELLIGLVFFIGFAMSAVNGMLYKIVPFLVWLHLNNRLQQQGRWQGKIPNMKQVIPERHARWQFRLHCLALGTLPAALLTAWFPLWIAALALLASVLLLWLNLLQALWLYLRFVREEVEGAVA